MSSEKSNLIRLKKSRAIAMVALIWILLGMGCGSPPIPKASPESEGSAQWLTPSPIHTSTVYPTASPPKPSISPEVIQNTQSPVSNNHPTQTDESRESTFVPIVGSADRIAFINQNEIWMANLDGDGLTQLTDDNSPKSSLQWSPDKAGVIYLTDLCINSIDIQSKQTTVITCFDQAQRLDSFQLSPDGLYAAISLDGQLYVIPFEENALSQVHSSADLSGMADCESLAPYKHRSSLVTASKARWSADGARLALLRQAYDAERQVELIQVIDITSCTAPFPRLDEFPATRFEMDGYERNPLIQDFAWNGSDLFALTNYKRNDGFGDLWIYNMSLHRGFKANPIGGNCCYRDPVFSPDGKYLAFVFQDAKITPNGPAVLYYLPYAALDTGLVYPPLSLPPDFFMEPRTKPQPILRSAE
jgi:hypothetical protein